MGRAERRRIARENAKVLAKAGKLGAEERKAQLFRNGITEEDLKKEYTDGFEEGFKQGNMATISTVFAATCLALHDEFGFGGTRCWRTLAKSYDHIMNTLLESEIIQEVYDVMGIEICLDDPIEPVMKKEAKKKARKPKCTTEGTAIMS